MPRVHFVKKARKDNPVAKRGESYYWWKFRYGGKRYSLTPPKQSQLTQSPYFAGLYDLQDEIAEADCTDADEFEALKEMVRDRLEEMGQECQESLDNMPDSLQYSPTGELLQERVDACESAASDLDSLDEFDEDEPTEDEYKDECHMCNGEGNIVEEDGEESECDECDGDGETYDENAHMEEQSSWEERQHDHYQTQKDEMSSYVDNCFV